MSIDIAISLILRLLLAFIFMRAAAHKVRHYHYFYLQLEAYRLLPTPALPTFAACLPVVEAYVALALLIPQWTHPVFLAAALLFVYALAMSINLVKGRTDLDCGCNGPSTWSQSISWAAVIRNGVLVIGVLATALPVTDRRLAMQDLSTVALASIAVILIYCSVEQAFVNQQRQQKYFALKAGTRPELHS